MQTQYRIAGATANEIAASIESGVRNGRLAPESALPPVRALAGDLGVAANTVAAAYRALRQRGVIETDGRRGTRVRPRPPARSRATMGLSVPAGSRDLASGGPQLALLPELVPALWKIEPIQVSYEDAGAYPPLLDMARERLAADGVPVEAMTVTSGALDGIERSLVSRVRPGDRVAVEDPGWANLLDLVAALGLDPVPFGVDDDGPVPAQFRRALHQGVSAVIVTSRAQNPTGAAVSAHRAVELREALSEHPDVLVVEDDHAAEIAGGGLHALAGASKRWVYLRSTSKPYGPDLRVAVLAGDETTVSRIEGRYRLGAGWVSQVLQRLVVQLWSSPEVADRVVKATESYRRRRDHLASALAARGIPAHGRTGLNVWVPVADETTALASLRDAGWVVAAGARFRLHSGPGLRITISTVTPEEIEPLADAIAAAVQPGIARRGV